MKIAIYTRKSKYSDKSESIDSQIEYCKQSARSRYPNVDEFNIYVDEGFSGGNTERPQYKKLLSDIKTENFTAVMCYKIDRISRSLVDFANLQEYLRKYDINIISASEGFDTSSPWGQAVLNILMIFAQLERSNVSERVRDTMLHYGKQGRWTGGLTPTGFESKSISYKDAFGHDKNMVILSPVEKEIEIVKTLYEKYLEYQSLNAVETFLIKNDVRTKKNKNFSVATIRDILINPVYAAADKNLYRYFKEKGTEICNNEDEFDGSFSVLPYNREDKKKLVTRPVSDWIVAISHHRGIVSGEDWVKVQNLLTENNIKKPRLGTAKYGIFSGLIRCAYCGSTMRIKNGRVQSDGTTKEFYYVCNLKEISQLSKCSIKNIAGHKAEDNILEQIEKFAKNGIMFDKKVEENKIRHSNPENEKGRLLAILKDELIKKEQSINNLVNQVSQIPESGAAKYIIKQIDEFDKEITELNSKIALLNVELANEKSAELNILSLKESLERISDIHKINDIKTKRNLMKQIISHMEWNGEAITIYFKTGDTTTANFSQVHRGGDIYLANLQTFFSNRFPLYQHKRISVKSFGLSA